MAVAERWPACCALGPGALRGGGCAGGSALHPLDPRPLRGARPRRRHGLARALLDGRLISDADQLPRTACRRDHRRLGRGLASGPHSGRLAAYSQGDGVSFLPSTPFTQGEVVTVHAVLHQGASSTPLAWQFTVAEVDSVSRSLETPPPPAPPPNPRELQHFVSQPDLQPPTVTVTTNSGSRAARRHVPRALRRTGPVRADDPRCQRRADLVQAAAAGRTRCGRARSGIRRSAGPDLVGGPAGRERAPRRGDRDRQQRLPDDRDRARRKRLPARPARISDNATGHGAVHRLRRDPLQPERIRRAERRRGRRHVVSGNRPADRARALRVARAGPRPAGQLLPARDAGQRRYSPWDYFHINALSPEGEDLLVDSRNTWAAYEIHDRTGQIVWELGGKHSSFAMGPAQARPGSTTYARTPGERSPSSTTAPRRRCTRSRA